MGCARDLLLIARWEVKRAAGTMTRDILPLAVVLFILLVLVTGFSATRGIHLQDGMYRAGIDDPALMAVIGSDSRFVVDLSDPAYLTTHMVDYDLVIIAGRATGTRTDRSRAALLTLKRDYDRYSNLFYARQQDLFAAYPLWVDLQEVKSELSFLATQQGERAASLTPSDEPPVPEVAVEILPDPPSAIGISEESLREGLTEAAGQDSQIARYTDVIGPGSSLGTFRTPSQLSPPLPFDSIVLIFVFIFPLYFTSQFYMMSIMHERIGRQGEPLLTTPISPSAIVLGKALPYLVGMIAISAGIAAWIQTPPIVLLPLIPVILFFLGNALLIGMVARSFKELSFLSIFFSTIATSYLFFPSVFANVHVVSLVSPLTLIVLTLQGTPFTPSEYLFSTSLFFLTSLVLFYTGVKNYHEERLFSQVRLIPKIREVVSGIIPLAHPYAALFLIAALTIPFVFMVQLMLLVVLFNLPMPLSLLLLLIAGALVEEVAKSIGIVTLISESREKLPWRSVVFGAGATAVGFLLGEKLLLFATLSQISESIFGSVLFLSLGALWPPLILHFVCVLVVAAVVRAKGISWYVPGIILATAVHCLYNLTFVLGWLK
ncbi:MAG: PrsW family intramembrane metalloprotease [Methanomicrobiales archaeon]|nr:PrsW family intramembrane metalloprotease [Methanomicrobiales archaeon]